MAAVPREIQQWIDRKYPKPVVDREWLAQCYEWAIEQDEIGPVPPYPSKLFKLIETQLLESNLCDSMDLTTGLPQDIGHFNTRIQLTGPPVLVEVADKDDTGISAFQLDQVRKAREERIRESGFDENGEGDEEADIEVEGEGPLPKYPRATLSLLLSDGRTHFKALEYKPLPELSLPKIPYGLKMQLKNVKIVAGVAYLQPDNVVICGGQSDMNEHRDFLFRQKLRERMGLPREPMPEAPVENEAGDHENDENDENGFPPPNPPPAPAATRRDDENLEPRRRRVPSTSSTLLPSVSRSRVSSTTSPYFPSNASTAVDSTAVSIALSPTLRATAPPLVTRNAPSSPMMSDFDDDFDFNMLDEIENQALTSTNRPGPAKASGSITALGPGRQRIAVGSSAARETEDATSLELEPKPTAFPRIFSSPPSRNDRQLHITPEFASTLQGSNSKGKSTSKTPFPTVQATSEDFFDDSTMDLGSEDLRQLESAEQLAFPSARSSKSTSRAPTSSSSATLTSGPPSSQRRLPPRTPKPSQPPAGASVIEIISSDEDDSSEDDDGMEVDDKENVPVERRRVRARVLAGSSRVAASQNQSQRLPGTQRQRPTARAADPDEILEISD